MRELKGIIGSSKNELEAAGLNFNQDGAIELDTSLAMQAIEDGDMQKLFSKESPFVNRLFTKMDSVKLNPVEYIDKRSSVIRITVSRQKDIPILLHYIVV